MEKQKCSLKLYSDFLIANQNRYSGVELSKVAPWEISHDSVSRWLSSAKFNPSSLWNQTKDLVEKNTGYIVGDDTLLSKKYSRVNELANKQYSGDVHGLEMGISLVNLLWTDGEKFIPVDYRPLRLERIHFAAQPRGFGFGVFHQAGDVLAPLGRQEPLQGFLDAQQAQVSPHQLIQFAQTRVGGRVGRRQQVVGAGGFDVAADLGQRAVALAANR